MIGLLAIIGLVLRGLWRGLGLWRREEPGVEKIGIFIEKEKAGSELIIVNVVQTRRHAEKMKPSL